MVTVSYPEYQGAFRNPMKGLRDFIAPGYDPVRPNYPEPYGALIKEYMQWNMLEETAEDGVDKILAYSNHRWKDVEQRNVKVIPRVFLVWLEPWHGGHAKNPDFPDDLNGWHWPKDLPPEQGPYKQIPGSVGAYVEESDKKTQITGGYFDPSFPERIEHLVEKLGKAWDNDPRVAYVEMGIIGEWGEHHDPDLSTVFPPHDEPEHVAGRTYIPRIQKVLGDAFTKAFKNKKVMVRYAYEFNDYEFGIYWDSWAQPQEQERGYNAMIKLGDRWKTQPIGGEITWNWGDLARFHSFEEVVSDESTRSFIEEQIRNLHCNHLGGVTWADFNNQEFLKNVEIIQKALGYRFVIKQFSYPASLSKGKSFPITFQVVNKGSSPFYYDWPVEISLLNPQTHEKIWSQTLDNISISKWMPGENWDISRKEYTTAPPIYEIQHELTIDKEIPDGEYVIALSILDPAGMLPSLRFANQNYWEGGYHPMGYIGINSKIQRPSIESTSFIDLQKEYNLHYLLQKPEK